jgi:hypothetical protein
MLAGMHTDVAQVVRDTIGARVEVAERQPILS